MNAGFLSLLVVALGSATHLKGTASDIKNGFANDRKPNAKKEVKVLVQGLHGGELSKGRFTPMGYSQATQRVMRTSKTNLVKQREFIKKLRDSIKSSEGKFKINEPQVKGEGSYKVNDKEIEVDMKILVDPNTPPGTSTPPGAATTAPASPPGAPPTAPASPPGAPPTGPASPPGAPPTGPASPPGAPPTAPASPPGAPPTGPASPPGAPAPPQVIPMMCLVPCPSHGGCSCSVQTPPQSAPPPAAHAPSPALVPVPSPAPTPPPVNKSTAEPAPGAYMEDILQLHNKFRKIHNAPPLTINKNMSYQASDYAEKIADLGALVNSGYTDRRNHGESLALICNENLKLAAEQAVKNWYDEVCSYTFGIEGPQIGTNHFSALVWRNTNQLGIGKAERDEDGKKCVYFVMRYLPSGNIETGNNEYVNNVEKGSFDSSYCTNVRDEGGLDGGYGFRRRTS